eukprot:gene8199-27_t
MRRDTAKHGKKYKTGKTIKYCAPCQHSICEDAVCGLIVTQDNKIVSLNKRKNWEILKNLKQDPTQRRSEEFFVNDVKYEVVAPVWRVKKTHDCGLIIFPQKEKENYQQRKACPSKTAFDGNYSVREKNRKKFGQQNLKLDFSIKNW